MSVSYPNLRSTPIEVNLGLFYSPSVEDGKLFESNFDPRIRVVTTGRSKLSCELLPGNGYVHEVMFLGDLSRDGFRRQGKTRFIDLSIYHEVDEDASHVEPFG